MSTTAPKSRTGLIIIIIVALIIVGIVVWYFFFKDSGCDPKKNGYTLKGKYDPKCMVADPKNTNTPPPNGTSSWVSDSNFPIKKGSWGPKVRALQEKLGVGTDGRFGPITEGKLKEKTGKTEIATQAEYDAIVIIGPAVQGGDNYKLLKETLGASAIPYSAGVYVNVPGQNKNYVFSFWPDGQFFFSLPKSEVSIAQGTYTEGGKKMLIDGDWFNYTEGSVTQNMKRIAKEKGE